MKTWEVKYIEQLGLRPLKLGDDDTLAVRRWRERLRAKGWTSIAKTGGFSKQLETATKVAQLAAGAKPDGVVGPITWRAVGKLAAPGIVIPPVNPVWKPNVIDCRRGRMGFPSHKMRRWDTRSIVQIKYLLGHYTGNLSTFLADANYHVFTDYLSVGGAPAIAYGIGIERDGDILVFNDWHDVTWHCDGGFNTATLGFVFLGDEGGPNFAQRRSLRWLIPALRDGRFRVAGILWPKMDLPLTSHRRVKKTGCPGDKGEDFFRSLGRFDATPTK